MNPARGPIETQATGEYRADEMKSGSLPNLQCSLKVSYKGSQKGPAYHTNVK